MKNARCYIQFHEIDKCSRKLWIWMLQNRFVYHVSITQCNKNRLIFCVILTNYVSWKGILYPFQNAIEHQKTKSSFLALAVFVKFVILHRTNLTFLTITREFFKIILIVAMFQKVDWISQILSALWCFSDCWFVHNENKCVKWDKNEIESYTECYKE